MVGNSVISDNLPSQKYPKLAKKDSNSNFTGFQPCSLHTYYGISLAMCNHVQLLANNVLYFGHALTVMIMTDGCSQNYGKVTI